MKRWGAAALLGVSLLATVGFWGYRQYQVRQNLETFLNNKYQMAFFDLNTHVQNLETALAKGLAATGQGEDVAVFSEIWLRADAAQADLNQLPVSSALTERTSKFLSQTGDYAYTISKDIMDKEELSDKHWSVLRRLYQQAADLNKELTTIQENLVDGKLTLTELRAGASSQLDKDQTPDRSFETVNRNMQTYPTLIYDGPFSDHLAKREPQGLEDENITSDQARKIALEFIDKGSDDYTARVVGRNKGIIEAYTVELLPRNNDADNKPKFTCDVSRQGGQVVWYLGTRDVGDAKLDIDQAVDKAKSFLESKGFTNMTHTYYSIHDSLATIQFVAKEDDVMIYPDQIKCEVALDDGRVLSYEATQYLMTNKERDIEKPKLTKEEAQKKLNEHMEVQSTRLAVIPLANYEEVLAWEFTGQIEDNTYLIYINAETGKKEKILMLVDTPNGRLTM